MRSILKSWNKEIGKTYGNSFNARSKYFKETFDSFEIKKNFSSYLDVGCGKGLNTKHFAKDITKVSGIDLSKKDVEIAKNNLKFAEKELKIKLDKAEFIVGDVKKFNKKADVVLQNPPFGVKVKHADKVFLEKAIEIAPLIYSFHKLESGRFIDKFTEQKGFKMSHFWTFDWPLKMTMKFHKKRIQTFSI